MEYDPQIDGYRGELMNWPGAWAIGLKKHSFVIVKDSEIAQMVENPAQPLDLSTSSEERVVSLERICEEARELGAVAVGMVYDNFFWPYRYEGSPVANTRLIDDPDYIEDVARLSRIVADQGLDFSLNLLAPVFTGPPFVRQTGEQGRWMHYRKGLRDPATGAWQVELWRQQRWNVHLGVTELEPAGVRVFAFREQGLPGSPYRVVRPEDMVEISETAEVELQPGLVVQNGEQRAQRVVIRGKGRTELSELNRVLVVQLYKTPEMDYFSPQALPFLKGLVDKYVDAGVRLSHLYSDEMTILADARYFNLQDSGEYCLRYVSEGMERRFAEAYGERYADLAPWMLYFCQNQEDFSHAIDAKLPVQHVWGETPEAIQRTALFRARYYRMLQDQVVDLLAEARDHAEQRLGRRLYTPGHPTWAESPTVDFWQVGWSNSNARRYEYTSNFVASISVHQAASAVMDYFKWGDYYYGNGNDYAEIGFLDRNYWGLAMASSTGVINELPHSYSAGWGLPEPVFRWRYDLINAFGVGPTVFEQTIPAVLVQELDHREVDVLTLYPIDLVAVEERFGSWMTQYAYSNYITQQKLLELGSVERGRLQVKDRSYGTLTVGFEPFPAPQLLEMMRRMIEQGGRVVWSGPPPLIDRTGAETLEAWSDIFGVRYQPLPFIGRIAAGNRVDFTGALEGLAPMTILTDFLVDRVYPIDCDEGTEVVARTNGIDIAGLRPHESGGQALYLGFRPRDDQAASLGYDERCWFNILDRLGAYPPTGRIEGLNDNTEYLSRTGEVLACRFPNGAVSLCPHLRRVEEGWSGHWDRSQSNDKEYLRDYPLPSNRLELDDFAVNGHRVTYTGTLEMSFRLDGAGRIAAFHGQDCTAIEVDGARVEFADAPIERLMWAPVAEERRVPGGATLLLVVRGDTPLRLPAWLFPERFEIRAEGETRGSAGGLVPSELREGQVHFQVPELAQQRLLYVVPLP